MRRRAKMKIAKIPKKKKIKHNEELVCSCDQCGKNLGRTSQRNANSAICAIADGLVAEKLNNKWVFFCTWNCAEKYESPVAI